MATINRRRGAIKCWVCGAQLVVRENDAGTITFACSGADGCDVSGFAKKGTTAAKILGDAIAPKEAAPPAPTPPAPAPAREGFSLAGLSR